MPRPNKHESRSRCPIACSLDVFGDHWSLVVIRDMFIGKRRFAEFLDSPESITTSVLTDRLSTLESAGLVERQAYQQRPPRYEYLLTDKGRALLPVLQAICRWGNTVMPGTWVPPESFMKRKR